VTSAENKGQIEMNHSTTMLGAQHVGTVAAGKRGVRKAALTKASLMALGALVCSTAGALAQAPAPAKNPPAAKAAAPAAAAAGQQAAAPSWVKLCEKAPFIGKDKDGKDVNVTKAICLTHHERLDGASGMVLVSAAIRDIEGTDKKHLMVMLPLGMAIPPGMQAGIYAKDLWDKIQKGEKVDDSKLDPIKLTYTLCHSAGCTAETDATPELIKQIQGGAGMIVYAVNGNGAPIAFPVPLNGFSEALAGAPADNQVYAEQRRKLLTMIAENQQKMVEEYRKENQKLQQVAPGGKPAAAPAAAPPAAGQPAAKKP
jgi:invasion protein IalB